MKKIIFILVLLAFLLILNAEQLIEFDKMEHDFGEIEEIGGVVSQTFHFTNIGTEELEINRVRVG